MHETRTRRDLIADGWTRGRIEAALRSGELLRLRRGHYGSPHLDRDVLRAVRVGGRLGCLSELRHRGIWVLEQSDDLHVHVAPNASLLRHPDDRSRRRRSGDCVVHWVPMLDPGACTGSHVGLIDALAAAASCLTRSGLVAAIDSALNQRLITLADLRRGLAGAPADLRGILRHVDARAESGLETIVRLLARDLGLRVRSQVRFPGIGVADLVVEGWIVVETDGSRFHDDSIVSPRDRRRDARHAAAGRTPLRFRYAQVVHELPDVAAALIGAVRSHRRIPNSGRLADRAQERLRKRRIT